MKPTITSKKIGKLTQHDTFPDWWESKEIKIPFFDKKPLKIIFTDFVPERDLEFIKEADQALSNFLKLDASDRHAVSALAHKNCMDFLAEVGYDEVDEALHQIKDDHEIWQYIYPTKIYVQRRYYNDKDIYVQVACECEWEQEHGLQLVFRQGKKLTRISDQDGHLTEADAYGKPDNEDELLSKFE
jgi:hypothetical protein